MHGSLAESSASGINREQGYIYITETGITLWVAGSQFTKKKGKFWKLNKNLSFTNPKKKKKEKLTNLAKITKLFETKKLKIIS